MKFMFAVIVLAFVAYANANAIGHVVDIANHGAPVGSHGAALINSWVNGGWNNGWNNGWTNNGWNNNAWNNKGWNIGWNGAGIGGHGLPSLHVENWGGIGDAHGHGHDGKYVASNRGAVHVAPLVGHIQSVKSTNAQPAPGTTW